MSQPRRPTTPCVNPDCGAPTIGRDVYMSLSREAREGLRYHGGRGLCRPCWDRKRRRGTVDYAPSTRPPRPLKPMPPCVRCGVAMVSREGEPREGAGRHFGRGLCTRCHRSARNEDTLADYERTTRLVEEVVEEWEMFADRDRTQAANIRLIAPRLGMTTSGLEAALRRARRRGLLGAA